MNKQLRTVLKSFVTIGILPGTFGGDFLRAVVFVPFVAYADSVTQTFIRIFTVFLKNSQNSGHFLDKNPVDVRKMDG